MPQSAHTKKNGARSRKVFRSRHHIHPRSAGGGNEPQNIAVIDDRLHRCIHQVFAELPPTQYLSAFSKNPHEYARKIIRALVRHFGINVIKDVLRGGAHG